MELPRLRGDGLYPCVAWSLGGLALVGRVERGRGYHFLVYLARLGGFKEKLWGWISGVWVGTETLESGRGRRKSKRLLLV